MMSLALTPRGSTPSTLTAMVLNGRSGSVWVASTCSTSEVPIPIASAPNAPCVDVWLSPQTTVVPGWVRPSCGPMMWTMPCSASPIGCSRMPNSSQLRRSVSTWVREIGSAIGLSMSTVGTLWSSVAIVRSGRRTGRSAKSQPVEGLRAGDLVHEMEVDVDQVGLAGFALTGSGGDDVVGPHLLGHGARLVMLHGS